MRFGKALACAAAVLVLSLSGCAKGPGRLPPPPAAATGDQVDAVQAMLMQGDTKGAQKQLKVLLKNDPMNPRLMLLHQSLSGNPQELLGPTSYAYTVRPGETIESLAGRLLGNRFKAYQLARYNNLALPVALKPGQVLRIPGSPPAPPRPAPEAPAHGAPSAPPATVPDKPRPIAKPVPAKPPVGPGLNPAAAQRARTAGLAALNRGAVEQAVGMLRHAHALDPASAVIARDLQRAERIAATVRSRK